MPFARPTTTATPDEIFEEWVHVLRHAELLALLYVVRRTLGFKKTTDSISYTQFLDGITTREGKVLDRGCGIKNRTTLAAALRRLEELGLIRSYKAQDVRGDRATTRYGLRFAGEDDHATGDRAANRVGDHPADPPTHEAEGGGTQAVPPQYAHCTTGGTACVPPVVRPTYLQQTVETTHTTQQTDPSKRAPRALPSRSSHELPISASLDSTDSMRMTGDGDNVSTKHPADPNASPLIAVVACLSAEFGDDAPQASRTRVLNMQHATGLGDDTLLPLLDEAAAITRSQAPTITKRGRGGAIIRMPYLLATLLGLIEATDDPTMAAAPASHAPSVSFPVTPDVPAVDDPPATTEAEVVWRVVLGEVRRDITAENYTAWFAPARALTLEENVLRVAVPTLFHRHWLEHKLRRCVERALGHVGRVGVHIVYDVAPSGDTIPPVAQTMGQAVDETVASPALSPTTALAVPVPAHGRQDVTAVECASRVPVAVPPPGAVASTGPPSTNVSSSLVPLCETPRPASDLYLPVASIAMPLLIVACPTCRVTPYRCRQVERVWQVVVGRPAVA